MEVVTNVNGETSGTSADQVTGNDTKQWTETKCAFCKQELRENNEPKLLPCLHSACKACLFSETPNSSAPNSSSVPSGKPDVCPSCSQEIKHSDVIDHLFLLESLSPTTENAGKAEEAKEFSCTNCEDSATATGFCVECQEWLCEACIQAHQRVRVTKDHSIRPKDEMEGEKTSGLSQKYLFCPLHRQEQLKLYCESCDKVTCRDCQLLEHQDHKYQFLSKACEEEKLFLQTLLTKITEKQAYIENARNTVNNRQNEISQREEALNQEIKMCAVKFITEINRRAKQLLNQLSEVCTQKKAQLSMKNEELVTLSYKLDHCLKFTEAAIKHGSEMALVYSRKAIINQLRQVLRRRCEVPNPQHVVDISFSYEGNYLNQCISQLGCLYVDRQPVGAVPPGAMQRAQHISSQGSTVGGAGNQNTFSVQSTNQQAILSAAAAAGQRVSVQSDRQQQLQQHGLYGQPQVTSSTHPSNSGPPAHLLNLLQTGAQQAQYSRTTVQSASPQSTTVISQTQSPSSFASPTTTGFVQKQLPTSVRHPSQQSVRPQQFQPVSHPVALPRNPNITISPVSLASNKQTPRMILPRAQRMPSTVTVTQTNSTVPLQSQVQKTQGPPPYPVLQRQLQPRPQVIVIDGDATTSKVLTMSNTPKLSHYPAPSSTSVGAPPVNPGASQVTGQNSNVASINVSAQARRDSSPHCAPSEATNSLLPSTLSDVLDKNSVTITNVNIKPEIKLTPCAALSAKETEKTAELSSKNNTTD